MAYSALRLHPELLLHVSAGRCADLNVLKLVLHHGNIPNSVLRHRNILNQFYFRLISVSKSVLPEHNVLQPAVPHANVLKLVLPDHNI